MEILGPWQRSPLVSGANYTPAIAPQGGITWSPGDPPGYKTGFFDKLFESLTIFELKTRRLVCGI